jgi:hypothetical protein
MDYPYQLHKFVWIPPALFDARWGEFEMVRIYTEMETSRRATRLILALEAWKLQHGSLPKTLDELVGTCLERIPVEPYSGKPFRYFPDGPKFSFQTNNPFKQLHWNQDQGNPDLISISISISANSPFLWATGPMVGNRNGYTDNKLILNEYRIFTNYGSYESGWYTPHSENDLLQAGWTFPIP